MSLQIPENQRRTAYSGCRDPTPSQSPTPALQPNHYQSLDLLTQLALTAGTGTTAVTLPGSSSLIGTVIYAQSAPFSPGINAFGFVSSNGLALTTDNH